VWSASSCKTSGQHPFSSRSLLKDANHNVILGYVVLLAERDDNLISISRPVRNHVHEETCAMGDARDTEKGPCEVGRQARPQGCTCARGKGQGPRKEEVIATKNGSDPPGSGVAPHHGVTQPPIRVFYCALEIPGKNLTRSQSAGSTQRDRQAPSGLIAEGAGVPRGTEPGLSFPEASRREHQGEGMRGHSVLLVGELMCQDQRRA
jgi:hypothetical protein